MAGVSLDVVGKATVQQVGAAASSSVEITGKVAVETNVKDETSVEVFGKAAVESKDGTSLDIIGKAAVHNVTAEGSLEIIEKKAAGSKGRPYTRTHMIHFSWTSACVVCTGLGCWCLLLVARFIYLWQQQCCLASSGASAWAMVRATVVLGMEVGLLVMAVLLVLLVPRMIITWTTAVVFDYVFGVVLSGKIWRQQVVRDGTKVAKEISWMTLTSVFEEGNAVAAVVLLVCFSTMAFFRHMITVD